MGEDSIMHELGTDSVYIMHYFNMLIGIIRLYQYYWKTIDEQNKKQDLSLTKGIENERVELLSWTELPYLSYTI